VRLSISVGSRFCAEANTNYARGDVLHVEKTALLRQTACFIISSSSWWRIWTWYGLRLCAARTHSCSRRYKEQNDVVKQYYPCQYLGIVLWRRWEVEIEIHIFLNLVLDGRSSGARWEIQLTISLSGLTYCKREMLLLAWNRNPVFEPLALLSGCMTGETDPNKYSSGYHKQGVRREQWYLNE